MKYIATAITALVMSVPAQAALQVYEFTASVTSLSQQFLYENLSSTGGISAGSVITLGDSIVGRFSYDSDIKPTGDNSWMQLANSTSYFYATPASPTNFFTFTILPSGQTVSSTDVPGSLQHVLLHDGKAGVATENDELSISGGADINAMYSVMFADATATLASNGNFPQRLSFAGMTNGYLNQNFYRADGARITLSANITSLTDITVAAVPEPGTWAMLLAGLGILGFSARRKRA